MSWSTRAPISRRLRPSRVRPGIWGSRRSLFSPMSAKRPKSSHWPPGRYPSSGARARLGIRSAQHPGQPRLARQHRYAARPSGVVSRPPAERRRHPARPARHRRRDRRHLPVPGQRGWRLHHRPDDPRQWRCTLLLICGSPAAASGRPPIIGAGYRTTGPERWADPVRPPAVLQYSQILASGGPSSPSPPLGAERVGVRWGERRLAGVTHLTLPVADATGPLPLPRKRAERAIFDRDRVAEIVRIP
jgi:hypothetical protein